MRTPSFQRFRLFDNWSDGTACTIQNVVIAALGLCRETVIGSWELDEQGWLLIRSAREQWKPEENAPRITLTVGFARLLTF